MSTNNNPIKNIEECPLTLNAKHIEQILGISRGESYNIMHREDFPAFRIGKRMLVRRDAFKEWYEAQGKKKVEE